MNANRYLTIYLHDHRAAEAALVQAAQRVLRNNRSTPWADELRSLNEAIAVDATQLDAIRRTGGIEGGMIKRLVALASERVGRLKPNGHWRSHSPLSRVLELEVLVAALDLKRSRWETLAAMTSVNPEWERFDFTTLQQRAVDQVEAVRPIHAWAVAELAKA